MESIEVVLEQGDAGARLDKVLALRTGQSRSQIQRWAELDRVWVQGKRASLKSKYPAGTRIICHPPEPEPLDLVPEAIPLDILFEDADLLVLNKAPGMVVHPGAGISRGTLVSALLHHCGNSLSGIGGVERPGILHRLDKDTSGALVVAKNDAAHRFLSEAFQKRLVTKVYQAFVHQAPQPEDGTWSFPLGRHPVHRKKQAVLSHGGRSARTDYRTLRRWKEVSLIECRLHTGRTHQIRVHASHAGCPLVGDNLYKGKCLPRAGAKRQMLHAFQLAFSHPRSGETLAFEAPVPDDFQRFHRWLSQNKPN